MSETNTSGDNGKLLPADSAQPQLIVADVHAWREWLQANDDYSNGVWLILAKKGTTKPTSLSYLEALEEALCSGWIDGQRKSFNETTFIQRFTPRRKASMWSQRNIGFIDTLTADGRMRERGDSEVEAAKKDGRWARAYAGSSTMEPSEDLLAALAASPEAEKTFKNMNSQNRYSVMHQIVTARTPELRSKRIVKLVSMMERGDLLNP